MNKWKMSSVFAVLSFGLLASPCHAQQVKDSSLFVPMVMASVGYQFPVRDLEERFYSNFNAGGNFLFKTKSNWLIGVSGYFFFRDKIREKGIIDSINTSRGAIIGSDGKYADIRLYERGFMLGISGGKLFNVFAPNLNSGIFVTGTFGLLQHKIRIEDKNGTAPQLSKEYRKGYDRLSNGAAFTIFAGYLYLSSRRLINFYGGFDVTYGSTQNRRSYNYDTRTSDTAKRKDILYGIRFGWVIPFYKRPPKEYYYH